MACGVPPRVHLERKRFPEARTSSIGSTPSDESSREKSSKFDSGSMDLETPQSLSPRSPQAPLGLGPLGLPIPAPRHRVIAPDNASGGCACTRDSVTGEESDDRTGPIYDRVPVRRAWIRESEDMHDYAEIYTPSRDAMPWGIAIASPAEEGKPPTPPLHRFPSWESRIYQVAAGTGFTLSEPGTGRGSSSTGSGTGSSRSNAQSQASSTGLGFPAGYSNFNIPVYSSVKGVSFRLFSFRFLFLSSNCLKKAEGRRFCMTRFPRRVLSFQVNASVV